jgi:hypothetical protein
MAVILLIAAAFLMLVVLDPPKPRPAPRDDSLIQRVMRGDL